ncbi:prepilin-type N-terminal cleavage/methylation domain-containing protein [Thioalkalivibrio sp. ALMg11]|uniref:prepilin-type N-terminal cleavage/methylation domain-containing protein n=1 Tax=Thioalkalivibrio sp. ALMg11 TaxID=1158165 RepID=UPI00047576F5|nr:prepilin-type N-terminal cleavage/methylation domain-containing protein [Thioalkalivibrio sp. ALMg11]
MLNHTRLILTPRLPNVARRSKGFTLVELMVGIVVGMIVIAAATSLYLTVIQSSAYTTQEARLTQETRITMDLIANDIRRSGYSHPERIAEDPDEERIPANPFMESAQWLQAHDFDGNSGSCILVSFDPTFRYDPTAVTPTHDLSDLVNDGEQYVFGYRQNKYTVEMLTGGLTDTSTCEGGTWEPLTDPQTTQVNRLEFDSSPSSCMKVDADGDASGPVYGPSPCNSLGNNDGDVFAESARVTVTLEAVHADSNTTQVNHSDTVSVRNLRIFD